MCRFGEADLIKCEVMLKDVADSRRINANIVERKRRQQSVRDKENVTQEVLFILSYSCWSSVYQCGLFVQKLPVRGMVLSAQFWPAFRDEKFELPQEMNDALQKFTKGFEALKGNRSLVWKRHLGEEARKCEEGCSVMYLVVV